MHQVPNMPCQMHIAYFLSLISNHILQFTHFAFLYFSLHLGLQAQTQLLTKSIL